jgi:hypothetical protein
VRRGRPGVRVAATLLVGKELELCVGYRGVDPVKCRAAEGLAGAGYVCSALKDFEGLLVPDEGRGWGRLLIPRWR